MEIKKDDWAVINSKIDVNLGGYANIAKQQNFPLKIYKVEPEGNFVYCHTIGLSYNNFQSNPFIINGSYLKIITEKKAKLMSNSINREYKRELKNKTKLLFPKHVPINDRKDYQLDSKKLLNTNFNYARLYSTPVLDDLKNIIRSKYSSNHYKVDCCSFTRTKSTILVYIPKTWLNYFGYNLNDLKRWIEFLKKCDIGYNAKVLGSIKLNEAFDIKSEKIYNLNNHDYNFFIKSSENSYEVIIPPDNNPLVTYLFFILTRYIYNSNYWNIPFIAMKLKKNMPKLSNWECLILAHNSWLYNGYYSLCNLSASTVILPNNNYPKDVLKRLSNNSSMNNSFVLSRGTRLEILKLITEENYEELQKLLN